MLFQSKRAQALGTIGGRPLFPIGMTRGSMPWQSTVRSRRICAFEVGTSKQAGSNQGAPAFSSGRHHYLTLIGGLGVRVHAHAVRSPRCPAERGDKLRAAAVPPCKQPAQHEDIPRVYLWSNNDLSFCIRWKQCGRQVWANIAQVSYAPLFGARAGRDAGRASGH